MDAKPLEFGVILHWDEDYQGYWIEVPSLPGCVSQGKTRDEALKNIVEAIQLYLEGLIREGREIPQEKEEGATVEVVVAG